MSERQTKTAADGQRRQAGEDNARQRQGSVSDNGGQTLAPAPLAPLLRYASEHPEASALRPLVARQLLALQASHGNQYVQRLVKGTLVTARDTGPRGKTVQANERVAPLQRRQGRPSLLQDCATRSGAVSKLNAALRTAQSLVGTAVRGLQELNGIWGQAPSTATQLSTSMALAKAFNIAFDKTLWVSPLGMDPAAVRSQDARDRAAARTILANFRQIAADLPNYRNATACPTQMRSGQPCFGCVAAQHPRCQRGVEAFVPPPFIGHPSSAILLCPAFFAADATEAAEMLVHELAHLQSFAASDIRGAVRYYGCPVAPVGEGPGLRDPSEFIGIADSYRCFLKTQRESAGQYRRRRRESQRARQIVSEST